MRRLFGGLLLGAGILLAATSGLCTGLVIISGLSSMRLEEALSALPIPLLIGGVPFVAGLGLFFAGRHLLRTSDDA